MRQKVELIETKCERCGKPLTTTRRALHGLDALKASFPVLCAGCTTPEEVYELNQAIGLGISLGQG